MELAALQGSVKQVNWAKAIRRNRLQAWQGEDGKRFQAVRETLCQQESASWWIANLGKKLEEVCRILDGGAKPKAPVALEKDAKGVSSADVGAKQKPISEGVVRTMTATGFIQVGPTRDMVTGEVVVDDSLPF